MLEDNLDLIRKIAWSYHKTNRGFSFDDLFNEACVAYLEAEQSYTPGKGTKKSTYAWVVIQNHLNNITNPGVESNQWTHPSVFEDISSKLIDSSYTYQPEHALMAKEGYQSFVQALSPMAQELVGYILEGAVGYLPLDRPKLARGAIKDILRDKGWSWANIWDTFREIKVALA